MKNSLVIIRACGEQPIVRRIFDVTKKAVYVTDDSQKGIVSLGFPLKDVFKYEDKIAPLIENGCFDKKWDWNKLKPLFE